MLVALSAQVKGNIFDQAADFIMTLYGDFAVFSTIFFRFLNFANQPRDTLRIPVKPVMVDAGRNGINGLGRRDRGMITNSPIT